MDFVVLISKEHFVEHYIQILYFCKLTHKFSTFNHNLLVVNFSYD
jgi:hypothetical protein